MVNWLLKNSVGGMAIAAFFPFLIYVSIQAGVNQFLSQKSDLLYQIQVQQPPDRLSDGSGLTVTTSRYYTPSRIDSNKAGIVPDDVQID